MTLVNTNTLATVLATYARQHVSYAPRGALLIRRGAGSTLAGVFGSGDPAADERAARELEAVRMCLRDVGLAELGFGLSPDGVIWMLVTGADNGRYQTAVG